MKLQFNTSLGVAYALLLASSLAQSNNGKDKNNDDNDSPPDRTLSPPQWKSPAPPKCMDGMYLLVARGSNEAQGEGVLAGVSGAVIPQIPGSMSRAIIYPARIRHYNESVNDGVLAMKEDIIKYLDDCPKGKVGLIGYSQGAQIIGDVLCGGSSNKFYDTPPLSAKYGNRIVAVVQFADPTFVADMPYDAGSARADGRFPRLDTKQCLPYRHVLRSWCDKGDMVCTNGDNPYVHTSYVNNHGSQAAKYLVEKYNTFDVSLSPDPGDFGGGDGGNGGGNGDGGDGDGDGDGGDHGSGSPLFGPSVTLASGAALAVAYLALV